jgi:hypothetical protein
MNAEYGGPGTAEGPRTEGPRWAANAGAPARRLRWLVALASLALGGCTLVSSSARPTPGAARNVSCLLEYRPDPARPDGPDVLFLAGASPYALEEAYMSLPDMLLHMAFAPGRHLTEPVRLEGVRCEPPVWEAGHRLPLWQPLTQTQPLLCRREGLERVAIEVRTKWGSCRREIPAGDATPRCRAWGRRGDAPVLARLSPDACPALPEPSPDAVRHRGPSGAVYVVVREGTGPAAGPEDVLLVHQTVVDRAFRVVATTHFSGEPRRLHFGRRDRPAWLEEELIGMRVGERRRVFIPAPPPPEPADADGAVALLYLDVELLAIEPAP